MIGRMVCRCAGDKRIKDRWNAVIKTGWGIAMAATGTLNLMRLFVWEPQVQDSDAL